jgi:hypothetical protein
MQPLREEGSRVDTRRRAGVGNTERSHEKQGSRCREDDRLERGR